MTNRPISQTINRVAPTLPACMTSNGSMLGASAGLSFGIYKGVKVSGCGEVATYSPGVLQSTARASMSVECTKCAICSGIPVASFLAAGCLGAVVLGSIGYAAAKPEEREAFRQDLISGRFANILCPDLRNPDRAHQDSEATFRNSVFDPNDDQPETITGHSTDVVVDQPTLPLYDDLFPPSYDEVVRAPEHESDQLSQPRGSANSSTPTT